MKPIILTVLDSDGLKCSEIVSTLEDEGFTSHLLASPRRLARRIVRIPFAGVLIFEQFDPDRIDRALKETRGYVQEGGGNSKNLIFCGKDLLPKDELVLRNLGVNKVVQSQSWKTKTVADRVLAALFGGFGTVDGSDEGEAFDEDDGERPYIKCRVPFKGTSTARRIIGATKIMRDVFGEIEVYSSSPDPVLIRGETGTGKELVAAAIHSSNDANAARKYIPINIAEIASDVLPSELFGHRKGAFTGAQLDRKGLLVEAGNGTVFIDEIGDLDKNNQARLLRVFANREIRPVGAEHARTVPFEARLIFATHQPLEEKCLNGEFRPDLYQRIREGHTIRLPSLAERKGDIELLAKEFFREWHQDRIAHKNIFTLQQSDFDKIVDLCINHEFPGNVRGLRGILRGCFNLSLKDQRFNIARLQLELEIDIERKPTERSVEQDEGVRSAGRECFVIFNPKVDSFDDFKKRAAVEYCTRVYWAAGREIDRALRVAKIAKKTFYSYLPKREHKRKQRQEVLGSGDENGDENTSDT